MDADTCLSTAAKHVELSSIPPTNVHCLLKSSDHGPDHGDESPTRRTEPPDAPDVSK